MFDDGFSRCGQEAEADHDEARHEGTASRAATWRLDLQSERMEPLLDAMHVLCTRFRAGLPEQSVERVLVFRRRDLQLVTSSDSTWTS